MAEISAASAVPVVASSGDTPAPAPAAAPPPAAKPTEDAPGTGTSRYFLLTVKLFPIKSISRYWYVALHRLIGVRRSVRALTTKFRIVRRIRHVNDEAPAGMDVA
uniref:Uncharacterized protein n=1 Tax=Oryza brachyantha TaxID=4533 RepID=J3MFC5_ORYBR